MKDLDNIKCFKQVCAGILGDLYSVFPQRLDLITRKYQNDLIERGCIDADCDFVERTNDLVGYTIDFLIDEGFIICTNDATDLHKRSFIGLRLTSKGLSALSRDFSLVKESPKEAVGSILKEQTGKVANHVIQSAIDFVISSHLG